MADNQSIVEYFYEDEEDRSGSRCGYCHSNNTSFSKGMWGHQVSCQDYQDLIDRGWRRSGKYLYKPTMKKTCCPAYTIRCEALHFKPSKSHKKVLKQVTHFLTKKQKDIAEGSGVAIEPVNTETKESSGKKEKDINHPRESKTPSPVRTSAGPDPNKPPCRKAKLLRKEKWLKKHTAMSLENPQEQVKKNDQEGKSLEDFLSGHLPSEESVHKLQCVLIKCDPNLPEFQINYQKSFELFCKYQKDIHKDKPEKLNESRIKLVRVGAANDESTATLSESHVLFAKYQTNVHNDSPSECGFSQFKRFLVDSPLLYEKSSSTPSTGWGSFHQQYFIDDKLIAVAVLDILPTCVSSVYFFYDTDYSFLSLGVYSALRELQFTRELNKDSANLKYYYMGFYIHSCPKMTYKAKYSPSYLACPETYSWVPVERCTPKLDINKYSRLDETDNEDPVVDTNNVLVLLHGRGIIPYQFYKLIRGPNDGDQVREYAQLVGTKVSTRMALFRS